MKSEPARSSQPAYHAYLLRFWQEGYREITGRPWRFSLEDVQAGTRRGFRDLDSLLAFLQDLTGATPESGRREP